MSENLKCTEYFSTQNFEALFYSNVLTLITKDFRYGNQDAKGCKKDKASETENHVEKKQLPTCQFCPAKHLFNQSCLPFVPIFSANPIH